MKHGFVKVAVATPNIRVADPYYNASELARMAKEASDCGVCVLTFPELSLTGCTCGDLFFSEKLISGSLDALLEYLEQTKRLELLSVLGLPMNVGNQLYDCAAVCYRGELLGVVPKSALSAADARYFADAYGQVSCITVDGKKIPFGNDLIFSCKELPLLKVAIEFASEAEMPLSPAVQASAAGADLICCLAASCETVGADERRRLFMKANATQNVCAYLYANAGEGESTTDLVFGGHSFVCEADTILAEQTAFENTAHPIVTEIDLERLVHDRRRMSSSQPCTDRIYREIPFSLSIKETSLTRPINAHPFTPNDPIECERRYERILSIQAAGLKQRIERAYAKKLVIGISGGLDSTLALLVMTRAIDALKRSRKDILAITMPCFGTTKRTKNNATVLCEELGVDFRTVDIFDAVNLHFRDIGHDPAERNTTYENAQARERTQILMDIANDCGGMVIGTGDLSELALGWATYNGDHMSMYAVNAAIPKTLVRHLVAFCARQADGEGKRKLAESLYDILDTPVSPELLPANDGGEIAQKTEDLVGPYELHDFFLYYMLRYGFSPKKLYRMAVYALGDRYDTETLKKWLKTFIRRFFSQQFKRSCMPDGPKVGSIGLSPRGDWQMPSDASSALWLAEAEQL